MYENEPKSGDSQTGQPRPGGLAYPYGIPSCSFVKHDPEHMIKPTQRCFRQNSQVKIERLEPSQDGPNSSDKPKSQDPNRLEGGCTTRDQHDRTMDG